MAKCYLNQEQEQEQELGSDKRRAKEDRIREKYAGRIPRDWSPLKIAYNFGRMGRIANLYRSNKRRRERNCSKEKNLRRMKRSSNANTSFLDDDILVYEILTRLPSKSLMRFKSVCKHWLSLIQHDSHFHDAHFTHSGRRSCQLFLVFPIERAWQNFYGHQECFFSADLDQGKASVGIISSTRSLEHYNGILNPVNGLICFFNINGSVCIYNPGTREITPWICSTLVVEDKNEFKWPTYGFGFDPTTKQYKVICVWRRFRPTPFVACEILTLGHNGWRRIDEVPWPYTFDQKASVYVKGSIYWIYSKYWFDELSEKNNVPRVIVAFDVGIEKFRTIPVPDFILNQRCDSKDSAGLLDVDGRVALFCRMDDQTVKLWIYFDDHNYDNKKNISTSNTNWIEETIKLPFCWHRNVTKLSFHGVAGMDQLILRSVEHVGWLRWPVSVYSYNRKTQSFKKIEISGISISDPTDSLFTPFLESIFPVSSRGSPTLDLISEFKQELTGPNPCVTTF